MSDKFSEIVEHIKKVYLTYNRPFIVGFSGGKDSTLTLQLVWEAIEGLSKEQVRQNIYVISTDTLVETPPIRTYLTINIDKINKTAQDKNLPIHAYLLKPVYEDSFWVNLIGKGYPAPSRMFRWCTERLKIAPVDRFIKEYVDKWGEATVVLGARSSESASRSQVLSKKVRDNLGLSKHPTLPAAYVFTPIEHLTTDDVWSYLMAEDNLWGMDITKLSKLYASAAGGECPMVLDQSTPACGNSRFGCWACTVVSKDTSMKNLIELGEQWMSPLLQFRDFLSETQDPLKKHIYRRSKRRDGKIYFLKDAAGEFSLDKDGNARVGVGPYKFEWRKEFLRRVLNIQKSIRENGPDPNAIVISKEELEIIRNIWIEEEHDWQDSVPLIYQEITGEALFVEIEDGINFTIDDFQLLNALCARKQLPVSLVARLIDRERRMQGLSRRAGIINKIDQLFNEDWQSDEEIIKSLEPINATQ